MIKNTAEARTLQPQLPKYISRITINHHIPYGGGLLFAIRLIATTYQAMPTPAPTMRGHHGGERGSGRGFDSQVDSLDSDMESRSCPLLASAVAVAEREQEDFRIFGRAGSKTASRASPRMSACLRLSTWANWDRVRKPPVSIMSGRGLLCTCTDEETTSNAARENSSKKA